MPARFIDYRFIVSYDAETGLVIAEIPALGIADDGPDANAALDNLGQMASFHLECLLDEGEQLPEEPDKGAGYFIRVRLQSRSG